MNKDGHKQFSVLHERDRNRDRPFAAAANRQFGMFLLSQTADFESVRTHIDSKAAMYMQPIAVNPALILKSFYLN
jgi:hypothetical protein